MPLAVALRQLVSHRLVSIFVFALVGCEKSSNEDFGASDPSARPTCANFIYQDDAQYYYDTHKAAQLAPDGNGVACPSLPRRPQSPPLGVERRVIGTDAAFDCVTSTNFDATIVVADGKLWLIERGDDAAVTVGALQRRGPNLAVPDARRIARHARRTHASISASSRNDGTVQGALDLDTGIGGYAFSCHPDESAAPINVIDSLPEWARQERINDETFPSDQSRATLRNANN